MPSQPNHHNPPDDADSTTENTNQTDSYGEPTENLHTPGTRVRAIRFAPRTADFVKNLLTESVPHDEIQTKLLARFNHTTTFIGTWHDAELIDAALRGIHHNLETALIADPDRPLESFNDPDIQHTLHVLDDALTTIHNIWPQKTNELPKPLWVLLEP